MARCGGSTGTGGPPSTREAPEAEHARLHAEQADLLTLIAGTSPIDEARLLAGPLRATWAALHDGQIGPRDVTVIAEAARRLPGRLGSAPADVEEFAYACERLQERVLPVARRSTLSGTRAAAKRAVLVIDTAGEARRRQQARCTRDVWISNGRRRLSTLIARMATEQAPRGPGRGWLSGRRCRGRARTSSGSPARTPSRPDSRERRADALVDLVLQGSRGSAGRPVLDVHLDIVVPLDALLGQSPEPVELRGAGPVSVEVLRDLLADPQAAVTLRRLVTDPVTGHLIDVGRRSYAIPARLREFLVTRDRVCRFPGCARSAAAGQIDHAEPWDDGGGTDLANLGARCTRHHQLKTHGGWAIAESRRDGSCSWLSSQGRRYDHHPAPCLTEESRVRRAAARRPRRRR